MLSFTSLTPLFLTTSAPCCKVDSMSVSRLRRLMCTRECRVTLRIRQSMGSYCTYVFYQQDKDCEVDHGGVYTGQQGSASIVCATTCFVKPRLQQLVGFCENCKRILLKVSHSHWLGLNILPGNRALLVVRVEYDTILGLVCQKTFG